jgi:hypothetical protein
MAVVQISKIQLRRGKKNQGTGLPQLASGELAWAIDTQELFVGNGAVSEGAPYVGNTKILTEHDSLLELANIYQYKKDYIVPIVGTVTRSLQSRLDDGIVNARNFGIIPFSEKSNNIDAETFITEQTAKIQQAINELNKINATLEFDPGEYRINESITLPSGVKIVGAGKARYSRPTDVWILNSGTSFRFVESGSAFQTTENASRISLTNFTIRLENTDTSGFFLNNVKNLDFSNISVAYYLDGYAIAISASVDDIIGLKILGTGAEIRNNKFKGLEFSGLSYAVYTQGNVSYNSFENCLLEYLYQGFSFGNDSEDGANHNVVTNCTFDQIRHNSIVVHSGLGNISRGNIFKATGLNDTANIINFITDGNSSEQDIFERSKDLDRGNPYVQEIGGIAYRIKSDPERISLGSTFGSTNLAFRLPTGSATGYKVEYVYKSFNFNQTRRGTLYITFDSSTNQMELVDDYEYVGLSREGEDAITFSLNYSSVNEIKHLEVNYINNNGGDGVLDSNTFTYTYSVLS